MLNHFRDQVYEFRKDERAAPPSLQEALDDLDMFYKSMSFRAAARGDEYKRQQKLKEWKAKSPCNACGRTGHWAGDNVCPMSKPGGGHGFSSSTTRSSGFRDSRVAKLATEYNDSQQNEVQCLPCPSAGDDGLFATCDSDGEDTDRCAFMVVRYRPLPVDPNDEFPEDWESVDRPVTGDTVFKDGLMNALLMC